MARFDGSNSGYAGPDRGDGGAGGRRGAAGSLARFGDSDRQLPAVSTLAEGDPFADELELPAGATRRGAFSLAGLLRFKWTMLATFVALAGAATVAIWVLIIPEYRAKATLEIPPGNPRVLYRTEDNSIPYYTQYYTAQPGLIRGAVVMSRVLEQPAVQQTRWYQQPKRTLLGQPRSGMDALRDSLSADPRPGTYMVDVSFADPDPHEAQIILGEVLDQYLAYAREAARASGDSVYQKLLDSRKELEAAIEQRKLVVNQLQRELGAGSSVDVVPRVKGWVEDRRAKLEELRREITTAQWQEQELSRLVEGEPSEPGASGKAGGEAASRPVPRFADDPDWWKLHIELRTVQQEIESNPKEWGPEHPQMVALRNRAKLLSDLLAERESNLTRQWAAGGSATSAGATASTPGAELAALRRRIGMLKKQEELLVAETQRRETDYEQEFDLAKRLDKEADALRYDQQKYDLVRQRIDEKETEGGFSISTRVAAPAFVPSSPDRDRRPMLTLAAVVAALAAACGAGYLRLCTSSSVHEAGEFAPAARAPFLGDLPLLRHPDRPTEREASLQNERVRMVRTALLERLHGRDRTAGCTPHDDQRSAGDSGRSGCTVLVTSAGPGAGKTTVTCLLGESLAQAGVRVLLVEADLRRPVMCQRLGVADGPGLVDLLRANGNGGLADEEVFRRCTPTLYLLSAGGVHDASDSEFLAGPRMLACLRRWRTKFDVILLDSGPVLAAADGRILARQVDGTIMVAREGFCRRGEIISALASLGVAGARMLGTVFISSVRSADYRHGYYNYPLTNPTRALDAREA